MVDKRSLRFVSGVGLANWLNIRDSRIEPAQVAVAAYIRWFNSGRQGPLPPAARPLYLKPVRARLRHIRDGRSTWLDLAAFRNPDYGLLRLVEVSRARLVERLKECRRCGRWFFAAHLRREFCSDNCRGAFFAAHTGKEKAAWRNRAWRIREIHLPAVEGRIKNLRSLPCTKSVAARLDRAQRRYEVLQVELQNLKAKLEQTKGKEEKR
jgi:ribosomal protein S27AE